MTLLVFALLIGSTPTATVGAATTDFFTADIAAGFEVPFTEGDQSRVSEFTRVDPRPRVEGRVTGAEKGLFFALDTRFRHERDFDGDLTLDLFRWAKVDLSYDRLPRRLPRDTLGNLGFEGTGQLEVSQSNVNRSLEIDRAEVRPKLRVTLPPFAFVDKANVVARYRYLARDGHEQVQTFAHCPTCHIHGTTRQLRQRTHEFDVGLDARLFKRVSLSYRHLTRSLDEMAPPPTFDYPRAPDLGQAFIPITGEQPFARVPDTTKNSDRLALSWVGPGGVRAMGIFARTRTENDTFGYATTANLAAVRLSARVLSRGRAAVGYRLAIVRQDVEQSIDHTGHQVTADARIPVTNVVHFEGGYQLDLLQRSGRIRDRRPDNNVSEGLVFVDERFDEKMTRHTARVLASARLMRGLHGRLGYKLTVVDNPLSVIGRQTSFAPLTGDRPAPSVNGLYPTQSTLPAIVHEVRAFVRWRPTAGMSVAPSYTIQRSEGIDPGVDEGSPRQSTGHRVGVVVAFTPTRWIHTQGAYHFRQDHVQTDLYFGQVGGLRADDAGWVDVGREALYESRAHTAIVSAVYMPFADVRLSGAGVYSTGEVGFAGPEPSSTVGALSAFAVQTKGAILAAQWTFLPAFRLGAQYRFDEFTSRPTGAFDGRRQSLWLNVSWVEEGR